MPGTHLLDDAAVAERIFDHIDNRTTDLTESTWREPAANYRSEERLTAEVDRAIRRRPTVFCPSAALPETGSYVARVAAGASILAVRGRDGQVRAFRNACRHRGAELAEGSGCEKAFVCPYHGWTYQLDGGLRHVPHGYGFPGLDKQTRGLVPLSTTERYGLVFVTQDESAGPDPSIDELAGVIGERHRLLITNETELPANWKVVVESFLEGYHIRATHHDTFFPLQFDNLNVVETFGPHSRVSFPYRNIDQLREVPPAERRVDGTLTFVYHLFPNAMVATFPDQIVVVVMEPLSVDRTHQTTYVLIDADHASAADARRPAASSDERLRGIDLVLAGAAQDNAVIAAVQRGLTSGANEFLEFGLFESAIGHFHRTLDAVLGVPDSNGGVA